MKGFSKFYVIFMGTRGVYLLLNAFVRIFITVRAYMKQSFIDVLDYMQLAFPELSDLMYYSIFIYNIIFMVCARIVSGLTCILFFKFKSKNTLFVVNILYLLFLTIQVHFSFFTTKLLSVGIEEHIFAVMTVFAIHIYSQNINSNNL